MTRSLIISGVVTTILNLFGCSEQARKKEGKLSKETEKQLLQSSEAYNNGPVYKKLAEQIIDTTSDERFLIHDYNVCFRSKASPIFFATFSGSGKFAACFRISASELTSFFFYC
jgi:hypothetical protein